MKLSKVHVSFLMANKIYFKKSYRHSRKENDRYSDKIYQENF